MAWCVPSERWVACFRDSTELAEVHQGVGMSSATNMLTGWRPKACHPSSVSECDQLGVPAISLPNVTGKSTASATRRR